MARSLYVLDLGEIVVDKGMYTPGTDDGVLISIPVPAYLIEADDGSWILIDTGMHEGHIDTPDQTWGDRPQLAAVIQPVMADQHRLQAQLALVGVAIDDIAMVVNTHLHFDHAGQNHLFSGTPILVQRAHYEAALVDDMFPNRYFDLPALQYTLQDGPVEVSPGVEIVLSPGHATALTSALVTLPQGQVLLAGDAIPMAEVIDLDVWGGFVEPELARESAMRLLDLARAAGAPVVYGHDRDQWTRLPHAPAAVDPARL